MGRKWTKEEDDQLRRWYRHRGSPYLETILDRSRNAIQARALSLGIRGRNRPWTRKEELYLKRNHGKHPVEVLAQRLNRTPSAVQGKAFQMLLTAVGPLEWSDEELAYLQKHYGKKRVKEMAEHLGRSSDAVELKANRIGLGRKVHRITAEEKKWIIRNLGKISYQNMADEIGVSAQIIQRIAHNNGYRPRPYMRPWTKKEVDYLHKHYGSKTAREIAEHLDRTIPTVRTLAGKYGLTRKRTQEEKKWTVAEEKFLSRNYQRMTSRELADELGRSTASVTGKVQGLGLSKQSKSKGGGS